MYPWLRLYKARYQAKTLPPLRLFETSTTQHICWPIDIDPWRELNNGRTLTLFDMGRVIMTRRIGLYEAAQVNGWGMAVAGQSIRYRRRVKMFDKIEMKSRVVGWDKRFIYLDQSMWVRGECTSQVLVRWAVTSKSEAGILAPAKIMHLMGLDETSPILPDWVQAWIDAENSRPWPPIDPTTTFNHTSK